MTEEMKEKMLGTAKADVSRVQGAITGHLVGLQEKATVLETDLRDNAPKMRADDRILKERMLNITERKQEALQGLYPSPYFVKCKVRFDGETESRTFYFAKFAFVEENIFSWTVPASVLRFETPGRFDYEIKDVGNKKGVLLEKEQYMITDGRIVYMTSESTEFARELIFQEYFSQHKSTFILPEIVEQMEKAQDKVIRAEPQGSFLISGPAGSGKTTLALHRAAYLIQSPDTADYYAQRKSIIFVQDASTRAYFGQLLPQLGIHNVQITTFQDWAREQLKLFEYEYIVRPGTTESQKDAYEFQKYQSLEQLPDISYSGNPYKILEEIYRKTFTEESFWLFEEQKHKRTLDRFDLTALLHIYIAEAGGLFEEELSLSPKKGGMVLRRLDKVPLVYGCMILDEVQNFLPQQITLLKKCIDRKNNSIMYVGDLAQQTRLCTLRDWGAVGEEFLEDRAVILHKNYRSTRQIMEYIQGLGFPVEIPAGMKVGPQVAEKVLEASAELAYITEVVSRNSGVLVGILAKTEDNLAPYYHLHENFSNIHVLTINEAQGVEFDVVCVVGVNEGMFAQAVALGPMLAEQRARVNRDLLYVALTRAMNELHVLGPLSQLKI
ncbi:MAG TPA: 3'-5' exonuclease [Patescibacteria group bacterium]|nr:3'-5' exonuclease [Patescibacteria group bacterium]